MDHPPPTTPVGQAMESPPLTAAPPEAGVYAGSATNMVGGLSYRMKGHLYVIGALRAGKGDKHKDSRHYKFAAQPDVSSPFFVLSRITPSRTEVRYASALTEGLFEHRPQGG